MTRPCDREECKHFVAEKNYCSLWETTIYPYADPLCKLPKKKRGLRPPTYKRKPIMKKRRSTKPDRTLVISFHLGEEMLTNLDSLVKWKKSNRSEIIRQAIKEHLELELNVRKEKA